MSAFYVIDPQMVEVESVGFRSALMTSHGTTTLAYDYVIDAQVVECRVIVILRRFGRSIIGCMLSGALDGIARRARIDTNQLGKRILQPLPSK